jgi:arginase
MNTRTPKIAVVGVPSAAGARGPGVARGPFELRAAGLLQALAADGTRVVNLSDLSLFPYRDDPEHPRARNAEVVACAVRAAADEMTRALDEGFTLMLGGDATVVVGAVAGARRKLGAPVALVYIDAHADLHTPDTTRSGFVQGMVLALALGGGPDTVTRACAPSPAVAASNVALLAVRDWEAGEREAAAALGLVLPLDELRRIGPAPSAARALETVGDGPVLVHFNVDAIAATEMPAVEVATPGGGLSLSEAAELLRDLLASPRVVGLVVTQYDPERDPDRQCAQRIVDLVTSALARHPTTA